MKIGAIIELFGIINLLLVLFQVSSGLRLFKVSFAVHKKTGLLLLLTALVHGSLAVYFD